MSRWPLVLLRDIAEVNPSRPPMSFNDDQPVSFFPMEAVKPNGEGSEPILRPFSAVKKGYTSLKSGDVLFAKITPCMQNRKIAVVPDLPGEFGFGSTEFHVLRPGPKVLASWLKYFLAQPSLIADLAGRMSGTVGQQRLDSSELRKLTLPLPSLDEQHRIVARLEAQLAAAQAPTGFIESIGADAEKTYDERLRSIYSQLVSLHDIKPLGELLRDGSYGTSVKCEAERVPGSTPVLRIPNVASEVINYRELKYGMLAGNELSALKLELGDLLIVRTNGSRDLVGRCAVVETLDEPTSFASYLIRLRFHDSLLPAFAQLMLRHLRSTGALLDLSNTSAGQYNVSLGRLKSALLPVPFLSEQSRVIEQTHALERAAYAVAHISTIQAKALSDLSTAILQETFAA